ncbi:MAG: hypothetical protein AAGD14_08145 [Planctomycetota bacterium]
MPRKIARLALKIGIFCTILFGLTEIALRIVPNLMPRRSLPYLESEIRRRAAEGRYHTSDQVRPLDRDDGGPLLRMWRPHAVVRYPGLEDKGAVKAVEMDEIGFGNPPGRYADQIDIITIGDSFTFPHAIDPKDAWGIRLGDLLGRSSYNLGLPRNGLHEYIQFLKQFGLSRKPKIVVLNVYEGNDLRDAVAFHKGAKGDDAMNLLPDRPWHDSFLGRNSYVYNAIRGYADYLDDRGEQKDLERTIDFRFEVAGIPFNQEQGSRDEPAYALWQQEGRYGFDLYDDALHDFVALAKEHGFRPIVTYSPWAHAVYGPVEFAQLGLREKLEAFSREQRAYFAGKAKELGYTFIDLEPALKKEAGREGNPPREDNLLYYPTTIHYTARGHAVVAEAIAAKLR